MRAPFLAASSSAHACGRRLRVPATLALLALAPVVAAQTAAAGTDTRTGDWGGTRRAGSERGIVLRGDYVSETLGVVDGGYGRHRARYTQQLRVGVDLDMARLAGWEGGTFRFTLNDRRGRSTSADLVGNRFPIQEAYGGQYTRLSELSYDRTFNGGASYFKLGYYAMGNQFASHTLLTNFVNAAFCAHPLAFMANSGWYNYPAARWGVEGAQQLTPAFNVRVGGFQVNPRLGFAARDTYAFRPFASGTTGSLFPLEATWKPGGAGRHPGVYKFGGYYDTSRVARKGLDPSPTTGRHGAYVLVEQKLYAPGGDRDRGLTAFAQYMVSDRATAQITRWYALGGVYQGIGRRDHDRIALGYVGADLNRRLLQARRATLDAAGVPADSPLFAFTGAEELFELSYSAQVNPWLMLRPDVQYIVNPGTFAYARTDNALAVGVQAKVTF